MLGIQWTNQYLKDLKLMVKRGRDKEKIREIIELLVKQKPMPPRCCDHKLFGDRTGCRDCHIESDWVLIYRKKEDIIELIRTGTHSDLGL